MTDFTKLSKEKIGKAYVEIVGYNPFVDDPNTTVEDVSKLMNEYDQVCEENNLDDTFFNYFNDRNLL